MATFTIKFGPVSSISGTTEDWGVTTVGEAVNNQRAKLALQHPDKVVIFVNDTIATTSQILHDRDVINLQSQSNDKG